MPAVLMPQGKQQFEDSAGAPLVGGRVYTYAAGTSTPLATYTAADGLTPNTNPVILDGRGEATIFWATGSAYKVTLADAAGVTIWTVDNIVSVDTSAAANALQVRLADPTSASNGAAMVGRGAQVVGSIAALKQLLITSPSKYALVTGYYAAGDGGGGMYYYDATDTTTADNTGTVIVAADGGRWKMARYGFVT